MEIFGIRLVGVNAETGSKLLVTIALLFTIAVLKWSASKAVSAIARRTRNDRARFFGRQFVSPVTAVVTILALLSIWFDDPARLATGIGLVTAGLAFALQKVVTSLAGYFVIMRGDTFSVGERITMGGVRGDVIALGFIHTTIMEMGQPASIQKAADPAMWVRGRQFTGRIVTVTNDKVFDEPIYNYTRDFPFIWEEMSVPIKYDADRKAAEHILLMVATQYTHDIKALSTETRSLLEQKYFIKVEDLTPRVFYRITDNWLELTVRFIVQEHGIRDIKDQMSRDILEAFEQRGIQIASATYEIVGLPQLTIQNSDMHAVKFR